MALDSNISWNKVVEAKGLEFDDVLIYGFFSDSPAEDLWRVVSPLSVQVKIVRL